MLEANRLLSRDQMKLLGRRLKVVGGLRYVCRVSMRTPSPNNHRQMGGDGYGPPMPFFALLNFAIKGR